MPLFAVNATFVSFRGWTSPGKDDRRFKIIGRSGRLLSANGTIGFRRRGGRGSLLTRGDRLLSATGTIGFRRRGGRGGLLAGCNNPFIFTNTVTDQSPLILARDPVTSVCSAKILINALCIRKFTRHLTEGGVLAGAARLFFVTRTITLALCLALTFVHD